MSSNAGYVYSLDANSGCVHWAFRAQAAVETVSRSAGSSRTNARLAIFFGDIRGTAYASMLYRRCDLEDADGSHPLARITGTPALNDGRLYVPVTSLEEPEAGNRITLPYLPRFVAASMPAQEKKSGRLTPFPNLQRSWARIRSVKTCWRRPAPACGQRRRWM